MVRAVMEGVAYSLRDVLELIVGSGISPARDFLIGMPSKPRTTTRKRSACIK